MIKIQINNVHQRIQEYADAITPLVAYRVSVLQQSLSHLNGEVVNFGTRNFVSFKQVTKQIINIVGDSLNMPNGRNSYTTSITNYLSNKNGLGNINIIGLLQFCQYLLANSNQQLNNLLICEPNNLMNLSNTILNNYGINTPINIAVIKLAFNYQIYNDISSAIKAYFREGEFTKICPYCNIEPVIHQMNNVNQVVRSFELDHFYDKSGYPLLSYSFFNLVPSDHTCNVTNKKGTEFTDEYHINPHFSGYTNVINFVPIGLSTVYKVTKIEVEISEAQGSVMYRKINGNNKPSEEQGELGNLNVFMIRSKYKNETYRASCIIKILNKENRNFKHIKKYINGLNLLEMQANYIKWYENELNVRFNSSEFNTHAYSKFCRDIHDHYFSKNETTLNRYIIELINNK